MPTFIVDTEKCKKDGICALVCPARIITAPLGKEPFIRPESRVHCIGCGHCVAYCPHDACRLEGMETTLVDTSLLPAEESVNALLRSRRSTRIFKETPIKKERITQFLDTMRYAPSASNRQPLRWIVLYEREKLNGLGERLARSMRNFASEQPSASFAPLARALASNWEKGVDVFFRGAPHILICVAPEPSTHSLAVIDGAIALTYMEIMATSMGLGVCWGGYLTLRGDSPEIRDYLGLNAGEVLAGAQMFGEPVLHPKAIPARLNSRVEWR